MFKQSVLLLAVALTLGACSSKKLDSESAANGSGAIGTQAGGSAGAAGAGQSSVAGVNASQTNANAAGPQGVGNVVYFDFDSFVVSSNDRPVVEAHARFLQANRSRRVTLEGNADERGGREYNLALGQKRAEAVRRSLNLLGVGDGQIEAISYGEEKPAVMGSTEDAYSQNRRVEFKYQ